MKKAIRLTETELHQLIENSVYDVLNEGEKWDKFKKKAVKAGKEVGKTALQAAAGTALLGGALLGREYINDRDYHPVQDRNAIVDKHEREANKAVDKKMKELGRPLTQFELDDIYNQYHATDESLVRNITNYITEAIRRIS